MKKLIVVMAFLALFAANFGFGFASETDFGSHGPAPNSGDGIPDGCDYCPKDPGIAGDSNGCHPCFGMDPYAASTKRCYDIYGDEFGVPSRLLDVIYPVTGTETVCDGNVVKVYTIRENGKTLADSKDCGTGYECQESGDAVS